MNKKKIILTVLALVLVCSISVAGTLALLTATQNEGKAVVNTFVAAGGGNIINPTPTPPSIVEPENVELTPGFFLVESKAVYDEDKIEYTLGSDKVLVNDYEYVVPNMNIPKDPKLTVDLTEGIAAYVFVKVIDTTAGNFTYSMASGWTEVTVSGLGAGEKVYVYTGILTGTDAIELNGVSILSGDKVTAKDIDGVTTFFTDTNPATEEVDLGSLTFEAYACQAGGFTSASDAYTQCFMG